MHSLHLARPGHPGDAPYPAGRRRAVLIVAIAVVALVVITAGGALLSGQGAGLLHATGRDVAPAGIANGKVDTGYGSGSTGSTGVVDGTAGQAIAPDEKPVPVPVTGDDGVDGSLLVHTGSIGLEVTSINDATAAARTAITGLGGFITGSSQSSADATQPYATVTYRIPSAKWDDALKAIHGISGGTVKSEQTQAVEVTGTVQDLGAQITNLRASETALLAIMAKAVKIEDVLAVQTQLTQVQGQIEQLTTQKTRLERSAAYGTLSVTFQAPYVAVTQTSSQWNPGQQVDQALAAILAVGQAMVAGFIWLGIVGLPLIVAGAIVLAILLGLNRRFGRRHPTLPADPAA